MPPVSVIETVPPFDGKAFVSNFRANLARSGPSRPQFVVAEPTPPPITSAPTVSKAAEQKKREPQEELQHCWELHDEVAQRKWFVDHFAPNDASLKAELGKIEAQLQTQTRHIANLRNAGFITEAMVQKIWDRRQAHEQVIEEHREKLRGEDVVSVPEKLFVNTRPTAEAVEFRQTVLTAFKVVNEAFNFASKIRNANRSVTGDAAIARAVEVADEPARRRWLAGCRQVLEIPVALLRGTDCTQMINLLNLGLFSEQDKFDHLKVVGFIGNCSSLLFQILRQSSSASYATR